MMTPYEEKTPVIYFAQMAMDCYNDPKDDEYRKQFNKLWIKADQYPKNSWGIARNIGKPSSADEDPKTGFYANFYLNHVTNVGVMAIRGTDSLLDGLADVTYILSKAIEQYDQAIRYFESLKSRYSDMKKFYICGHSLGGIVAKMIFPRTKVNTIAFNSPGVVQYLKENNKPYVKSGSSDARCVPMIDPYAITYCANGDPIGNLRHDNDVGAYKWLPVLGEERIPDQADKIDRKNLIKGLLDASTGIFDGNVDEYKKGVNEIPEFDKAAYFARLVKYHGMDDLYTALKQSSYKNDRV